MHNIIIAKITSAHGIKGAIKIMSFSANPEDVVKYSNKMFDAQNQKFKIKIINNIPSKNNNLFIAQIEGVTDRNQAELLKNTELFINRGDLKKSRKDEFYYVDIIGLDALDLQKNKIGKVVSVNDFGAGGLVEIQFSDKKYNKSKINNFAFTHKIFPEINTQKGYLIFDMPDVIEILEDE